MDGKVFLLNINQNKIKYGLSRTKALLKSCGNPQNKLTSIQIVGTNGKGSTSAMITNSLYNNKYRVGHFTSPHLIDITERIKINGQPITAQHINKFINLYKEDIIRTGASFFEIISVMAIDYFANKKVDIAILETGLGGRLDSITAMKASGLIITPISIDHIPILGNTLSRIAKEKAGAISKHNQWIISSKQINSVQLILNKEAQKHALKIKYIKNNFEIFTNQDVCKYLPGEHQIMNAHLAYLGVTYIATLLNKPATSIKKHILNTYWPGRIQKLQSKPDVFFDVAHNSSGIKAFNTYFKNINNNYVHKYLVIGFESNKIIFKSLNNLIELFDSIIITETKIRHSMKADILYKKINCKEKISINCDLENAIQTLKEKMNKQDVLVILGSHYFGNALNKIFKNCFEIKNKAL